MFRNLKRKDRRVTRISTSKIRIVTEMNCVLSRAKVKVVSREPASNVECEDTRLTDTGRKEKVKVEMKTGRKEKGDTKEKVDPKERDGPRESGQVQVTRGTILGIIPIGTARRMVLRWIRGRLYSQFETELRGDF